MEIKDNFCRRTETLLNAEEAARVRPFETVNLGVHGYGVGNYYLFIKERLMKWNPDAVVIALYSGNDFYDNYYSMASAAMPRFRLAGGKFESVPMQPYTMKFWLRDNVLARSSLMRFLWLKLIRKNIKLMDVARGAGMVVTPSYNFGNQEKLKQAVELAEMQLEEINEFLRSKNVKLFVFVIPHPRRVRYLAQQIHIEPGADRQLPIKDMEFVEPEITGFLSEQRIPFVFPLDFFARETASGKDVYLQHGKGHLTVYGHELSAGLIEKPLYRLISQSAN